MDSNINEGLKKPILRLPFLSKIIFADNNTNSKKKDVSLTTAPTSQSATSKPNISIIQYEK